MSLAKRRERSNYSDSLAFPGPQGMDPSPSWPKNVRLAHLTSAPPVVTSKDGKAIVNPYENTLKMHQAFQEKIMKNTALHLVTSKSDLNFNDTGLLFGLQHAPEDLTKKRVQYLKDEGLFAMILAFGEKTKYGCGFACEDDTGLTPDGRNLINWMSVAGMVLDLSHASHKTARDALIFIKNEKLPIQVMASHTGSYAVYPHKRNLPDDILKEIARMKGYIGVHLITFFLGAKECDELEEFIQHLMHIISVCGEDAVGVGSDCPHMDMSRINAQENYKRLTGLLKTNGKFGERFPDRPEQIYSEGSRMFEILRDLLLAKVDPDVIDLTGRTVLTRENVDKVLGLNFRNFVERSLPE